jgi:hypothetical protein
MNEGEKIKLPLTGLAGTSGKPGRPFNPTGEVQDAPKPISPPRAIPIGRPVSSEEYEKLKEAAKHGTHSTTQSAQEDRGTTEDHD